MGLPKGKERAAIGEGSRCPASDSRFGHPTFSGTNRRRGKPWWWARTAKGKAAAARNAIRHGILSASPIVGDETIEDWEVHYAGVRESLQPVGHHEEVLVHDAAFNRWQKARLQRWSTELTRQQVALASFRSRDAILEDLDALPEDEALWRNIDAEEVLRAFDAMPCADESSIVEPHILAGIELAVKLSASRDRASEVRRAPAVRLDDAPMKVAQLRAFIEQWAVAHGRDISAGLRRCPTGGRCCCALPR